VFTFTRNTWFSVIFVAVSVIFSGPFGTSGTMVSGSGPFGGSALGTYKLFVASDTGARALISIFLMRGMFCGNR
jgi:hypothetical protein